MLPATVSGGGVVRLFCFAYYATHRTAIFVLCYYYYLLPSSCAHIILCCSVWLGTYSRAPGTARVVHKSLENSRTDPAIASRPRAREQWADHSYAIIDVIICNIIVYLYTYSGI